jgi:hypothetical protein
MVARRGEAIKGKEDPHARILGMGERVLIDAASFERRERET